MGPVEQPFEGTRLVYDLAELREDTVAADPLVQLRHWLDDAVAADVPEPTAFTLSTVDGDGQPRSRVLLLRGLDTDGIVFYTNLSSAKGTELAAEPRAAAQLLWIDLHRQVRLEGTVSLIGDEASDAYFAGRPRDSQIGAWASPQSEVIAGRDELDRLVAEATERFRDVEVVPRPPHWGGLRLVPHRVELWQGRPDRLHDRLRYRRSDGGWVVERLAP